MVIDVTNDRNDSVNKKLRFPIRQLELRQVDDLNSDLELNEEGWFILVQIRYISFVVFV